MKKVLIAFSAIFVLFILSCGETATKTKTKPMGSAGGPCYPNETCDKGLECVYNVCLDLGGSNDNGNTSDDGDTGNTGDTGNSGNTGDTGDSGNSGNSGDSGNSGNSGDSGDSGNSGNSGNSGDSGCTLSSAWASPDSGWKDYGHLRMTGEIADYSGSYKEATYTEGKIKAGTTTKTLTDGSFMNYQNSVILADAVFYEFLNVNQGAGTATVDYWSAMWQFSRQLVPTLKSESVNEVDFGAMVFVRRTFIDVKFNSSGQVTDQYLRKNCYLSIAVTEQIEDEGEYYDVPVGGMYGCFENNVGGNVGETLKMMFRNKMTSDNEVILEWLNTRNDGSVAEYGDEDFQWNCQCYEPDGHTEVDCWEYDGPGGAEPKPDIVE